MARKRFLDLDRRAQCPVGMVVVPRRHVIGHQHGVALELVDDSAVPVDDRGQKREIFVEQARDLVRRQFLAYRREIGDVGIEYRRQPVLGLVLPLVADDRLGHGFRHVAAEGIGDEFAFIDLLFYAQKKTIGILL